MDTFIFQPRPVYPRRARIPSPPPPPPVTPANVIATTLAGEGLYVIFEFDREITLQGGPPYAMDDAIQINDTDPIDAWQPAANRIGLAFLDPVAPGSGWNVNRTPDWCATELAVSGGTVG